MDPLKLRLCETITVGDEFKASERELVEALSLLGDDDIKWEMIRHLAERLETLQARHEGLETMVKRSFDRDFAISEFREMIKEKRSLAAEIRQIMSELEDDDATL